MAALVSCTAAPDVSSPAAFAAGYEAGIESQLRCPTARLTNRADLSGALDEALREACGVFESTRFRDWLRAQNLARKCPRPFGRYQLMAGEDIYRMLATNLPAEVDFVLDEVGGPRAVAVTNVGRRSITIEPWKLTGWRAGDFETRAGLVNTLVHEMTHLVPTPSQPGLSFFQDSGQWVPWCDADRLVSYRLGNEAERLWAPEQSR